MIVYAFQLILLSNLRNYLNCRQQDLLKKVVEVKPKKPKVLSPSAGNQPTPKSSNSASKDIKSEPEREKEKEQTSLISKKAGDLAEVKSPIQQTSSISNKPGGQTEVENPVKSLLGLAYPSSDDED